MSRKSINNPTATGIRGRQGARALFEEDGPYDLDVFHDTFLDCEDLTEYEPALSLLTGVPKSRRWREWNRIKRDWPAFNTYIQEWREELEVLFKSRSIKSIIKVGHEDDNLQANKWLAEQGFNKRQGAGRPSKAEKDRAAKEIASQAAETKEERERVLRLVNNGE
jgi:hypothetical protein